LIALILPGFSQAGYREKTQRNANKRIGTQGNAGLANSREESQPANNSNPKPEKQTVTKRKKVERGKQQNIKIR
jgi:hypothetical protein